MKNHRLLLKACFGADRAGVYYTTIGTRLLADEIAYIGRDCGARMLVVRPKGVKWPLPSPTVGAPTMLVQRCNGWRPVRLRAPQLFSATDNYCRQ